MDLGITNKQRNLIKKNILKCLTEDFKGNQAIFDKKDGFQIFNGTNLDMVMEKVVKGLEFSKSTKRGEDEHPNDASGLHLHDVMASALAINEDFQKQLLNRWGFTEDGSIDVKNQLKIFAVLDWIKKNGNPQHLP